MINLKRVVYEVKPRLGEILREKNMTQTQLSELANIPQSAISRFDKNEQHKDIHLVSISRALNLTIDDLYEVKEIDEKDAK